MEEEALQPAEEEPSSRGTVVAVWQTSQFGKSAFIKLYQMVQRHKPAQTSAKLWASTRAALSVELTRRRDKGYQ